MRSLILRRVLPAACTAVLLVLPCAVPKVLAASSKPLVLDTEAGISDGKSGTVLQTAPLPYHGMAEAMPAATPAELPPNSSPPIIVSPNFKLPAGKASASPPANRPRPTQ